MMSWQETDGKSQRIDVRVKKLSGIDAIEGLQDMGENEILILIGSREDVMIWLLRILSPCSLFEERPGTENAKFDQRE